MTALDVQVRALLANVARRAILPRFGLLADAEREEKSPGDWVTVADREAEALLDAGLRAIDPDARVIGEEACALALSLLDDIGTGRLWLVDPLDGTNNFAAGRTPFGMIVALVEDGVVQSGWLYDPVADRLCYAARGVGAFVDGARISATGTGRPLPVAAFSRYWMSADKAKQLEQRVEGRLALKDGMKCAAAQYPALTDGHYDAALFERVFPWDHAAGALFVEEAGGKVAQLDDRPYRIDDPATGLLAAASPELWARAAAVFGS
ncbi:inositol monophosphatase [Sphingomonas sp. NBWT7]|uniref:inositol monophosphatase family protein n=1 Tax=Sphingomonas sp. NBWT7 TaxID=2596913 RepID=UPI00162378D3|nr:inositol monophosphatase family protein [Sphingomonas sp. NBWT7]QNE31199.1 inositol monophosphatase [Sphingomonas sp. NBWT7]